MKLPRLLLLCGAFVLLETSAWAQGVPGSVERGRYLVEGVLACGNCHMQRGPQGQPLADRGLSGGMFFDEGPMQAHASNITPDPETGVGRWTDAQLAKAIREGLRPDGSLIGPPMPIAFYRKISDADLADVIAYLRAQPPVKNTVAKSKYAMPLPAAYGPPVGQVSKPSPADKLRYGQYLADIGHCMDCHTPRGKDGMLAQGAMGSGGQVFKGPFGSSVSRNLTAHETGLKGWTDAQVETAVRTGKDRNGQPYKPPMAFAHYARINQADMAALIAYIRTLPPLPMGAAR